jgi:hypothetical protein
LAEQRGDHGAQYDPNGARYQPAKVDAGPPDWAGTVGFHSHILALGPASNAPASASIDARQCNQTVVGLANLFCTAAVRRTSREVTSVITNSYPVRASDGVRCDTRRQLQQRKRSACDFLIRLIGTGAPTFHCKIAEVRAGSDIRHAVHILPVRYPDSGC